MSYSAAISKERAAKLQNLCATQGLTSLIFTVGLDCNRNKINTQVFNWLFKGVTGTHTLANSSLDFDYEEIAWIVTPDTFEIYVGGVTGDSELTQKVYEEILDITITWKGVNVYLVSEMDINDADVGEATKVLWFVRRMTRLLGPTGACAANIEKWPIVQAYALDFFEAGFFSMKHPVTDISAEVQTFFTELDPAAVYIIMHEHMTRLARNFKEAADILNKGNVTKNRRLLKIENIERCLTIPFEYALLQKEDIGKRPSISFLGSQVQDFDYVVLRGVCGDTALECYRTWFFEKGIKEALLNQNNSLRAVYKAVAVAMKGALEQATSPQDFNDHFARLLQSYEYISEDLKAQVVASTTVSYSSVDMNSKECSDGVLTTFKAICNIGQIPLEYADSCLYSNGRYINLTAGIEELAMWETDYTPKPKPEFGDQLCQLQNIELFTNEGVFSGKLTVFEEGWVYDSLRTGIVAFSLEDFTQCVKVSNFQYGFFTESSQLWLKVPSNANIVKNWTFGAAEAPFRAELANPWLIYRGETPRTLEEESKTAVPVHIIIGPPGSGKNKFAKHLARREWQVVAPDFASSIIGQDYTIPQVTQPSIIVVPALSNFNLPEGVSVRSVIVKINGDNLMVNQNREFWPCLLPQIATANTLVLTGGNEISEDFMRKIKAINPTIEVYRVGAQIAPNQATNILDSRRICNQVVPTQYLFPLQSLYLDFDLIIDINSMKKKLASLNTQDIGEIPNRIKWHDQVMTVNYIKGTVSSCEEKENLLQETQYDITGTPRRLYIGKTTDVSTKGLLFVGRNLDKTKLMNTLLQSKATYGTKIPIRTKASLTPQEIAKLRETLELPGDWNTDGNFYYDPDGARHTEHPMYEPTIADFLEDENERIGDFNRKVQKDITLISKANEGANVMNTVTYAKV